MNKPYLNILDIYYITNGELFKQNKILFNNLSILTTTAYDDVINRQEANHLPKSLMTNCKNSVSQDNEIGTFKKHFILCFIVIIALLLGVVLIVLYYVLNTSPDLSPPTKNPLLNPDLCDSVNPYYGRSWFTPSPTVNFFCDVPIEISEVFIKGLHIINGQEHSDCLSKLDCLYLIGFYYLSRNGKSEYNFFIDYNSNVYEGRGWMCPYASGQLWVGVIADSYTPDGESEEMKRILNHFNNEIIGYAAKCGFLDFSNLKIKYLNVTVP